MTISHGPEGLAPLLATALGLAACASGVASAPPAAPAAPQEAPPPAPPPPADTKDPLLGLGQSFHGQGLADQTVLTGAELLDRLATADLICFGERYAEPIDHWAELAVMFGLSERAELSGRSLGLGLQMWDVAAQPAIDRYAEGKLDEPTLLELTRWDRRWGHDYGLYRPTVALARAAGGFIGLDAPRSAVRVVKRHGLDGLDPAEREALPQLDLDDPEHHDAFVAATRDRPSRRDPEHRYAARVLRDETMAQTATGWLGARRPARQLLVLAGVEHCRQPAVPSRVARRLPDARTLSVRLLLDADPAAPGDVEGYDYAFLLGEAE